MKVLSIVLMCVLGFALTTQAEEGLAGKKAKALEMINQRITKLQSHKACVEKAADKEALVACRKAMKADRMERMKNRGGKRPAKASEE
ncbi:MAG: hypothetical protein VX583_12075 [Bdellovibrionota bacterium]|nr:hypothetical protein [Pseudobdellovibrionaceae bacterium]